MTDTDQPRIPYPWDADLLGRADCYRDIHGVMADLITDLAAALRAALATRPEPSDHKRFVQRLGDAIADQLDQIDVRAIAEAVAGSAAPEGGDQPG